MPHTMVIGWSALGASQYTIDGGSPVFGSFLSDGMADESDQGTAFPGDTPLYFGVWSTPLVRRAFIMLAVPAALHGVTVLSATLSIREASGASLPSGAWGKGEFVTIQGLSHNLTWITKNGIDAWPSGSGGNGSVQNEFTGSIASPGTFQIAEFPITVSDVQTALTAEAAQIAIRLKGFNESTDAARPFFSCEAASPSNRPFMTIVYSGPPADFDNVSPADDATGQAVCGVTLQWDDAVGATSYKLNFGTTNPPPLYASNIPTSQYTTPILLGATEYFWQPIAVNADGETSGDIWSFTTSAALTAPTLTSPANAATDVPTNPTYQLTAGTGATRHDFYIRQNGSSDETIPSGDPQLTDVDPAGFTYIDLQHAGEYEWGILSSNACQQIFSGWSGFTTEALDGDICPHLPDTPNPADAATGVSINLDTLAWSNN